MNKSARVLMARLMEAFIQQSAYFLSIGVRPQMLPVMVAAGGHGGNGFAYGGPAGGITEFPPWKRTFNLCVKEISTAKGFAADKCARNRPEKLI